MTISELILIFNKISFVSHSCIKHVGQLEKLNGFRPPLYRIPSGDYRILYRIKEKPLILCV